MTKSAAPKAWARPSLRLCISGRIAAAIGAAIIVTAAALISTAAWISSSDASARFAANAKRTTELFGSTLSGEVKFKKADALVAAFEVLSSSTNGDVAWAAAYAADGALIAQYPADAPLAIAAETAQLAISEEAVQTSSDGLTHALPSRFGKKNTLTGAIVVGWSDASLSASINDQMTSLMVIGAAIAVLLIAAAAYASTQMIGRPLRRLARAVGLILEGEDITPPGAERTDEIGVLARSMTAIHAAGAAAQQVRTALDASSAMLIATDAERRITFANRAFREHFGSMGVDAEPSAGKDIDSFFDECGSRSGAFTADDGGSGELRAAGRTLALAGKPIQNSDGGACGIVVEARDVTSERNVLDSIDGILAAAAEGDFSGRIETNEDDGALHYAGTKINGLLSNIQSGLAAASEAVSALADGKLSARMRGEFEGGFAELQTDLNESIHRISELVSSIQSVAATINAASGKIQSNADHVASRAESQAASLEETSATMAEISAATQGAAKLALDANKESKEATNRAERGGAVVADSVGAMKRIQESSGRISEIIAVIDSIAFQTNLLALNAAVEAARAGDAGKGFAVVASEVRTLAQRSAEAANDIKSLIQESTGHVDAGVRLVEETGGALKDIVDAAASMASALGEISTATQEQTHGVQEVTAAVRNMDEVTQANAAAAEEAASASRALRSEAERLADLVAYFAADEKAETNQAAA